MADEAPFQLLHYEVLQYVYNAADGGDAVRCSETQPDAVRHNRRFIISPLSCTGTWKKRHQSGEHGIQSGPRAAGEVTLSMHVFVQSSRKLQM